MAGYGHVWRLRSVTGWEVQFLTGGVQFHKTLYVSIAYVAGRIRTSRLPGMHHSGVAQLHVQPVASDGTQPVETLPPDLTGTC